MTSLIYRIPIPFCPFSTTSASGHGLNLLLWKSVNMLSLFGFKIQYASTDGAQSNMDHFKLLLPNFDSANPTTCSFNNIYCKDNPKLIVIMDSHINHVKETLKLEINSWDHFKQAYLWDISINPFPIHYKLTQEQIFLTSEVKMRNKLAEDVLDDEMLHLMEEYQSSLGEDGVKLDATIALLKCTCLIRNFRDPRPVTNSVDDRQRKP
ncbi:hypothetical protein KUTeg_011748 [Tegillarca granosa]|uniref:DDE-1 domain-containing protein n=1 Tax=Tegillarca granosa TaxID=220873 RepID=A0ABQ9F2U5_TEGGR|nr:hypothetical protein KUTeg_011748 [Tegillarca granosa]